MLQYVFGSIGFGFMAATILDLAGLQGWRYWIIFLAVTVGYVLLP